MKKTKLLFAMLCTVAWANTYATVVWTDKTSLIANPSFETDEAISNLKDCGWATDRVTGWTIAPSSSTNAQIGVGNSSSTIQGIGSTFSPYAGDKYFYTRNNWNASTTYTFTQVITRDGDNMPSGLYKLTCKAATYSSDAAFNTLTLGLKEGTGSAVTHNGIVLNVWNTWGVIIYKRAADTNLTIEVTFKPGYDGGGKHYALLMDDFHLEYISEDNAFTASSSNTIDFSDIINNAGIYNHSTKGTMPRGWTATKHTTGNGNYTEGEKGDTRLEGWSGSNLDIDYNQTITNLPAGTYTVTAAAQERAKVGRTYVYASTEGQDEATGLVNNEPEYDVTTSALKVTNGTMKIGIKSTANDWVTADNFRISFLGFDVDAVKDAYETAYSAATTARDASENENIVGTERTTFEGVISTYTTSETQSYSWYVTAEEALDNALDAFVTARTNYDALVAEIAKATALGMDASSYAANSSSTAASALTSTQNLKVAEYTYVTTNYSYSVSLGEWTSTGTNTSAATFNNEHWSGETHEYKNQKDDWGTPKQGYAADSWSINFSQDVTLPAGDYVFKVAGRQASGDKVNTSLVVKNGEDVLGTVSDFPRSNSSRGINKSGETDFEGEDSEFANGGAGYGWEWRYVKFTLDSDATVNIAINSVATAASQWVSFGDYTLQTDNEANISLIAYNIALNDANSAIINSDYENVTGAELGDLQDAIDADDGLDKSKKDDIDAAKDALVAATTAFTDAKGAYDAFVAAKAVEYEDNLPYASSTKFAAIGTAQAATATSASDATSKTAAIISAYRKYVESNAMAEGVTGAENKTSLISDPNMDVTYDGTEHTFGAWQVFSQVDGTINLKTEEDQPMTDSEGNKYKYADIWKSDNNGGIKQTLSNLPAGKYLLTVAARAQNAAGATFGLFAGDARTEIPKIDNTGGVFGNGWNDVSLEFFVTTTTDVEIGVQSGNGKTMWWGATRFRLVRLGDATESVTVTSAGYATYASDYPLDFTDSGIQAYIATTKGDGTGVNFTQINKVPAGTGVLLYKDGGATEVIPFFTGAADATTGNVFVRGTGAGVVSTDGTNYNYILNNGASGVGFYKANGMKVATNRAYISVTEAPAGIKEFISLDLEDAPDGISLTPALSEGEGEIYNLAGQRMNKMQKGINIVNGKKVLF